MRFLTCGADGILVELADLDETLRVFAALQSAVKHAVEQTAESPERAARPSATSVFAGVKQLIPAARTVYVAFDPLWMPATASRSASSGARSRCSLRRVAGAFEIWPRPSSS